MKFVNEKPVFKVGTAFAQSRPKTSCCFISWAWDSFSDVLIILIFKAITSKKYDPKKKTVDFVKANEDSHSLQENVCLTFHSLRLLIDRESDTFIN